MYQSTWTNPYLQQSYQQTYQQPYQQSFQQPVNGIIKTNGKESALQYSMPPNSTSPAIFDNDGKTFYVVSTDGVGSKTLETFDYAPHVDEPVKIDNAEFVSREEFDSFTRKVEAALGAINESGRAVQNTRNRKKSEDNSTAEAGRMRES